MYIFMSYTPRCVVLLESESVQEYFMLSFQAKFWENIDDSTWIYLGWIIQIIHIMLSNIDLIAEEKKLGQLDSKSF